MSNSKQSSVNKEFVPYKEAFALKQLDFKERCLGYYLCRNPAFGIDNLEITTDYIDLLSYYSASCKAPTFSQAFRWFRDNYGLCIVIKPIDDKNLGLGYSLIKNGLIMKACTTYEESELACLKKLIEIQKGLESQQ